MDLRIVKTEKVIREAFMKLRAEQPLEKIKVKDICDAALINKSTFYKHYLDVFDLSDKLENEFIEHLIEIQGWETVFENPEKLLGSVDESVKQDEQEWFVLFKDRIYVFWRKLSSEIVQHYKEEGNDSYAGALLFIMGGLSFSRLMFNDQDKKQNEKTFSACCQYIRAIGKLLK